MFVCHKCNDKFNQKRRLDRHLDDRKFPCDAYLCKTCKIKFPNAKVFKKHQRENDCYDPEQHKPQTVPNLNLNSITSSDFLNNREYFAFQLEMAREETKRVTALADLTRAEIEKAKTNASKGQEQTSNDHVANQTIVSSNINGNNNVIIQLISFGNENLSGLSTGVLNQISSDPYTHIPNLAVQKIYFNPKCPENHIIKPKHQLDSVEYYDGGSWKNEQRYEFAKTLLDKTSRAINRRCNQMPLSKERLKLREFINTKCLIENDEKEEMELTLDCNLPDHYNDLVNSIKKVSFE